MWSIIRTQRFAANDQGQSLVETALVIPMVLLITFNAVNFGYLFFVGVHLASAPRVAVEHSIQGFASPAELTLPAAGPQTTNMTVSWLAYQDMVGLVASSDAQVQVCSKALGIVAAGTATCAQYPAGASFPVPGADPESNTFVLHRVDVRYTVTPLLPTGLFGLLLPSSLTFHRQVSMRAMD
jgi:hypothetical protein